MTSFGYLVILVPCCMFWSSWLCGSTGTVSLSRTVQFILDIQNSINVKKLRTCDRCQYTLAVVQKVKIFIFYGQRNNSVLVFLFRGEEDFRYSPPFVFTTGQRNCSRLQLDCYFELVQLSVHFL